ncbi:hypothetical protein U9M48_011510 [Paspalum notatum var. saurae]|uniref:Transposase n=1 Tax=Paspalum notatum var. saurae TaxID=547442 RepID=A0AAQ3SVV1_PASNO
MQNKEEEFAQAQESGEGSDEDEDYPIPAKWRERGFGNPVVHDAKQQEWEYRQNEVVQGARYTSSELLKESVKLWSLSLKKKFKVVKSSPSVEVPKYNRNLTAAFVANEMYGHILDVPYFKPKKIIREIELEHKYTISYAKAYRAKQKVFEMRFGTYEDSYDNLPCMLATIAERNPGTYYDVMYFPNPEGGKYKGTILTAIGVDGNNQVLPVVFAFVENENAESWYWFLERVKAQVVSSRSNVCLISDRHAGILDAIEKLQHRSGASPHIWPDVHSRWCMSHLAANFHDHFKNKDLMDLFKKLCSQNQQRKFNAIWKVLDELTAKHQAANPSASSSGTTTKPFSHWIQDKPKGMAEEEPTPELLDPGVDSGHRSYLSAVQHKHLATFQCRPPKEYLELDNHWIKRLRGAGLLTFCRLVEGGPVGRHGRARPRMMIDNSLITALVDRWRPETHTFHLPCGEMAPTLQDVTYLLGLPIVGDAVGPRVVPASWRDDLEVRFAGVNRVDHLGPLDPHPNSRGPAKSWLLQFKATNLHPDTDDDSIRRSLEAYLLWLFGFIMFKNSTSKSVDKVLIPYAQEIADAPEDAVPLWSWGSAVLAATYRGLCDACIKDKSNARFQGCALLLQLWSYERLAVGRPVVDHRAYEAQYYGEHDDDGPTMGTLWVCPRERIWANEQGRRTYPNFVVELDRLVAEDVIWESYSAEFVASRAPYGLSSWCTSNETL